MSSKHLPGFSFSKHSLPSHGQIQVIFGPMFSGKTTELIRRIKRYGFAKYNCLLVKYANDVRYDDICVATHDRQVAKAVSCTLLEKIENLTADYDVIGIDEGQFFPDVVTFSENMANKGKTVVVAALDGTFQRKGFGSILDLVPLAESVIKLSAVCMNCFGEGSFTKRFGSETEIEVIGGAETYMAACRLCHMKEMSMMNTENIPNDCEKQLQVKNKNKAINAKRRPLESIRNDENKKIKLASS